MATESDRFRIAVALTALKFKPPDQSFTAYVLKLRSQFPPASTKLTCEDSWRSLALKLEHDLEVLKEKYEAERIKTSALESGVMMPVSSLPAPNPSLEQPVAPKKKQRKKSGPTTTSELSTAPPDLRAILEDLSLRKAGFPVSCVQSQQSFFSALDSFMQLTALPEARLDLLSSVTLRTLNAIAKQINDVISSPNPNAPSDSNTLNCLGIMLYHVLTTSLPPLEQGLSETPEPIIAVLDRAIRLILVPIVNAFHARSEAYLGSLFLPRPDSNAEKALEPTNSHRNLPADIRVNMLDLFRKIFCFLDGRLQSFTTLTDSPLVSYTFRASLILATIRELDRVLSALSTAGTSHDTNGGVGMNGKRTDRVKKLAKKDSLWYLCTVLHILFCESPSVTGSQLESVIQGTGGKDVQGDGDLQGARLLSKGISDSLFELITRCKRPSSSTSESQRSGFGIETLHVGVVGSGLDPRNNTPSQEGLQCAVEETRTGGFRTDGHTNRGENTGGMGADAYIDVRVNAAGHDSGNGHHQPVGSLPQGEKSPLGRSTIQLDEVGYGMLLGVLERYWVWSRSWEL